MIKFPAHITPGLNVIYDATGRWICGWKDIEDARQLLAALNATQPDCPPSGEVEFEIAKLCSLFGLEIRTAKDKQAAARIVELEAGYAIAKEELHDILESRDKTTKELFDAYARIGELEKACGLAYEGLCTNDTEACENALIFMDKIGSPNKAALGDGGKDGTS